MVYSGMTITPARAEQVTFSIPYWTVDQGVAVRADSAVTMEEFAAGQLVIGVQRSCSADQYLESDYFGPEMYSELINDGSIKLYDTFPQSMVALEQGLVDAVIFDDVNINSYIRDKPTLMMLETIATGESYGVAMRNEDVELHEIINAGIADLMASDKWDELLLKYVIVEDVVDEDIVEEDVAEEDVVDEDVVDEDIVEEDVAEE
jgi:polar amino acid transport system substrate-binding protein